MKEITKAFMDLLRSVRKLLRTSKNKEHSHTYLEGDTKTSFDKGHKHDVIEGVVQEANGHVHKLRKV